MTTLAHMKATPAVALQAVRLLHTAVWVILVGIIVAIPVAAWHERFGLFALLTAVVLIEVVVLAMNGLRCPLTDVAARYTDDRSANFDIYLPLTIARYNKQIFGSLFLSGVLFGVLRALV